MFQLKAAPRRYAGLKKMVSWLSSKSGIGLVVVTFCANDNIMLHGPEQGFPTWGNALACGGVGVGL